MWGNGLIVTVYCLPGLLSLGGGARRVCRT